MATYKKPKTQARTYQKRKIRVKTRTRRRSRLPRLIFACLVFAVMFYLLGKGEWPGREEEPAAEPVPAGNVWFTLDGEEIPLFDGETAAIILGDDMPDFTEAELAEGGKSFLRLAELDELGRCGSAAASLVIHDLPIAERGTLGDLRPSGYHNVKYDDLIEDGFLYNRCHLIAYALSGINDDPRDIITGTRYLNYEGMLPLEQQVLKAVYDSDRILYRVTPVFCGDELVCRGVRLEALSLPDRGKLFHMDRFCYNVQPGIEIDYETGESKRAG